MADGLIRHLLIFNTSSLPSIIIVITVICVYVYVCIAILYTYVSALFTPQDQYAFCHRAALEYLSSFDHYGDSIGFVQQ